jgi:hypothetical protein
MRLHSSRFKATQASQLEQGLLPLTTMFFAHEMTKALDKLLAPQKMEARSN